MKERIVVMKLNQQQLELLDRTVRSGVAPDHAALVRVALRDAGVMVGGAGLQLPEVATTVKLHEGKRLVQDGPYADTKEQLGGYFIIDVPDLDTALDWAARCPVAPGSVIEVRPNVPLAVAFRRLVGAGMGGR